MEKCNKCSVKELCTECLKLRAELKKEYDKKYYQKNKEKKKQQTKKYYEENKEKMVLYSKEYYLENIEEISSKNKLKYQNNKDIILDKNKKYYEKEKENILINTKIWKENNKNKLKEQSIEYYKNNKNYILNKQKAYQFLNKEKIKDYNKTYKINNKEKIRKYNKEYSKERRKNDPLFKLKENIKSLIKNSFNKKGYIKNNKTFEILGCSIEEFRLFIQSKFENWMNDSNYGVYTGNYNETWQLDHITPISSAMNEEEILKLNHYTNFQPLCSKKNLEKSNNL